jgi:hypothetical protein
MQGATRQHVNAEEMLAKLKRVLESSALPPNFPRSSVSMVSKPGSSGQRPEIDKGSDRRAEATTYNSPKSRRPTDLPEAIKPTNRSWKRVAVGAALAGAALICAAFTLVIKSPNLPGREPSILATEGLIRPQGGGETLDLTGASPPVLNSRPDDLLQSSALQTRADTNTTPANTSSLPVEWGAAADVPQPASFGFESVAPAFTPAPPNQAAAPAPQVASLGGTPTASALSSPASMASARPDGAPKPPTRATAPASVSTESARPSTPKIDSTRKPPEKSSLQKPVKSTKTSARPFAQTERRSPQLASPNEAQSPPQAAQDAGKPTTAAAPASPTIGQRFADGVTHGFSYLAHLPGALLPHSAIPNSEPNPSGTR